MRRSPVPLCGFHLLLAASEGLLLILTSITSPVVALEECKFPAIFVFGASYSDTGGVAATFGAPPRPFGETYFGRPAGRFSDGRLVVDFLAQSFGLPYLSAYLDSIGTNFSHGANFAVAASTVLPQTSIFPRGRYSPFYLDVQYYQFTAFKNRSRDARERGGIYASLMPKEEYFSEALYLIDMGANDLGSAWYFNKTEEEVNQLLPEIANNISSAVKNLYNTGARYFLVETIQTKGCLASVLAYEPVNETDNAGCGKYYNNVSRNLNSLIKNVVVELRKELPSATIAYVDFFGAMYKLFSEPQKHGFVDPLVTCCGYGGNKYNYDESTFCGSTGIVNGTQRFIGSCKDPSVRVLWDGIHLTESAYKFIFDQLSTGAYSDPHVPLKMVCHKSSY